MGDFWAFLIVRMKLWAYSPSVLRDVAVLALVTAQMWLMVRSSETMRKFRRSIDAANGATQMVLDTTAAWSQRIEELERRVAALEQRALKPHYVLKGLPRVKSGNGDARGMEP